MSDDHKSTAVATIEHGETATMSPVVAAGLAILREHPSAETLRELLAVQREWEANEARKAYSVAIVALKRDLPRVIGRDKLVDFSGSSGKRTTYNHASLAHVLDEITDAITAHGFALTWQPAITAGLVSVTCRLSHQKGHHEEATIAAAPDASGNKSAPQAIASTITLLQRYTALSLLGIATADMKEPIPVEPDPERVDSARNLKAVGWLTSPAIGRTRHAAEEFLGRSVSEWTAADLARLRTWAMDAPREPGDDK